MTAKNAELDASVKRETERFDLAMDAIKLFHGDVSKDLLLKEEGFEKLAPSSSPERPDSTASWIGCWRGKATTRRVPLSARLMPSSAS